MLKNILGSKTLEDKQDFETELKQEKEPIKPSKRVIVTNRGTTEKLTELAAEGNERGMLLKADVLAGLISKQKNLDEKGIVSFSSKP